MSNNAMPIIVTHICKDHFLESLFRGGASPQLLQRPHPSTPSSPSPVRATYSILTSEDLLSEPQESIAARIADKKPYLRGFESSSSSWSKVPEVDSNIFGEGGWCVPTRMGTGGGDRGLGGLGISTACGNRPTCSDRISGFKARSIGGSFAQEVQSWMLLKPDFESCYKTKVVFTRLPT